MASNDSTNAPTRARQITWALSLALGAFAMALVETILRIPLILSQHHPRATLVVAGVAYSLWLLVIWQLFRGYGWARIVFAVCTLLSLSGALFAALQLASLSAPSVRQVALGLGLTYAIEAALNAGATVLLFTPPASLWYRAMRERRSATKRRVP